jgi:hypothetical protein
MSFWESGIIEACFRKPAAHKNNSETTGLRILLENIKTDCKNLIL